MSLLTQLFGKKEMISKQQAENFFYKLENKFKQQEIYLQERKQDIEKEFLEEFSKRFEKAVLRSFSVSEGRYFEWPIQSTLEKYIDSMIAKVHKKHMRRFIDNWMPHYIRDHSLAEDNIFIAKCVAKINNMQLKGKDNV